jgi:hypothetical protein
MDTEFYHLYIYIDISQAKFFCSLLTLAREHSDLAGHRPPFASPLLATGLNITASDTVTMSKMYDKLYDMPVCPVR